MVWAWVPSRPEGPHPQLRDPPANQALHPGVEVCHYLLQKPIMKYQNKVQTWSSRGQERLGPAKKQGSQESQSWVRKGNAPSLKWWESKKTQLGSPGA